MKFEIYNKLGVSFLVIKDVYTQNELQLIQEELNFLYYGGSFTRDKNRLVTAQLEDGSYLAERSGVWLDNFYRDRNTSIILRMNRKLFAEKEIVDQFVKLNPYHIPYSKCDFDSTLLQYYENSDYYKSHTDHACFSIVTWFFQEPKKFVGGNLRFTDLEIDIEIENNMSVIFPSFLYHEVDEVKMLEVKDNEPIGRFSMSQFLLFKY